MRDIASEDEMQDSGADGLVDRRQMLAAAAAATVGVVAAFAVPGVAAADNGDFVHVGVGASASGGQPALSGYAPDSFMGVWGESATGDGIEGFSHTVGKSGLYGLNDGGTGSYGVFGRGGTGVAGTSNVVGGTGVRGIGEAGTGVWAEAPGDGMALFVDGRVKFSRSGVTVIAKGRSSATATVPISLRASSKYLVTMQGFGGSGVYVQYGQKTGANKFKIQLNKAATRKVNVAWIVLD